MYKLGIKWELEKSNLVQYILTDNLSYEEIGRKYNCTGNNIRKIARKLGIELPKRRSINNYETFNKGVTNKPTGLCQNCGKCIKLDSDRIKKFCSIKCASEFRKNQTIKLWKDRDYYINPNYSLPDSIRDYLYKKTEYKCESCGFSGVNRVTNRTILQIHHVDGDSSNNKEENLQVLCPNCHAMTETFMGLNKNKSRRVKRYKKILKTSSY